MVADVPLGATLSGGIDSSLLVSFMAKELGIRVETFTVSFGDREFDELSYASVIARHLGLPHRTSCRAFGIDCRSRRDPPRTRSIRPAVCRQFGDTDVLALPQAAGLRQSGNRRRRRRRDVWRLSPRPLADMASRLGDVRRRSWRQPNRFIGRWLARSRRGAASRQVRPRGEAPRPRTADLRPAGLLRSGKTSDPADPRRSSAGSTVICPVCGLPASATLRATAAT